MITVKDIEKKTMTEAKKKEAKNSLFAFYVGRPISYALTIPCLYANISPNAVTYMSIIFAIAGFGVTSFCHSVVGKIIGMILFFLWNIGDGIDGNIARYRGLKSANGDLLDTLGGYVALSLLLLSMGNAAYYENHSYIQYPILLPAILAGISAVSTLIPRLLMHRKLAQGVGSSGSKLKDKETYSFPKIVALNLCDPAGFQWVIAFVAIVTNTAFYFTIIYFIINVVVMIYSIKQLME